MNINGISVYNAFEGVMAKNVDTNNAKSASSFVTILNGLLEETSLTETNPDGLKSSVKRHPLKDKDNQAVELGHEGHEHNYCSLCGSPIEADGSCPMCIVPMFICGNGNHQIVQTQNVSQIDSVHIQSASQITFRSVSEKK
ncbi:MAG: hypothetical protein LBK57_05025 [Clostridiales Family XIII bacterium]|jgi:hypothetical protein|nr:hypothetical protein [Clostridiales Family XIII bacterium]